MAQELGPFDRRTLLWLVTVGAGSLLLGVYILLAVPSAPSVASSDADTFSRSAIGHRGFIELLRASRFPLVVSRHNSAVRAAGGVLVLLEPHLDQPGRAGRLEQMLENGGTTLLVLPKWEGVEDPSQPGWLKSARLLSVESVSSALSAAHVKADVVRRGSRPPLRCGAWTAEVDGVQLLQSTALTPLVACDDGILLGEIRGEKTRLLVLSDPDVLANHGLARGENAALAVDIVKRAGAPARVLIVDETLHGHEMAPSLWNELFRLPLVLAVVQAALALGALLWSGLPRFGAPVPVQAALAPGKNVLIENTASLLRLGGHAAHVLERYLDTAINDTLSALHTSRREPRAERLALLARQPGLTVDIRRIESQVRRIRAGTAAGDGLILSLAQKIHRWKEEVIRGPELRPRRPR
jgi:hypothetical protein